MSNRAAILEGGTTMPGHSNFTDKKFSVPDATGQSDVRYPKSPLYL